MQFSRKSRTAIIAGAALALLGSAGAIAQPQSSERESRGDTAWYGTGAGAASALQRHAQHDGTVDHLPAVQENMELVSKLELTEAFGDVVPGQIADVAVHKGFAYLNSWDEPSCTRGGTYIVDIRDPEAPDEIGFVPAPAKSYHGEGAHAVTYNGRDILAVNNEGCTNASPTGPGGFDLIDVTDPFNPVKLGAPGAPTGGDTGPDDGSLVGAEVPHSNHSAFMWEHDGSLYLVTIDNLELYDVDIFDISNPAAPVPVAEYDLVEIFPQIWDQGPIGSFAGVFHHDTVVKHIDGKPIAVTGYWDGGYVTYDLSDPFDPQYVGDSSYEGPDPLTGLTPPEGNAHYAEFSHDNEFILAADEDFTTHRSGEFDVEGTPYPASGVGGGAPAATLPDRVMNGPTVYGGYACPGGKPVPQRSAYNFALEPGEEAILVVQRGPTGDTNDPDALVCFPGQKAEIAWDAGWRNVLFINRHLGTADADAPFCGSGGYVAGKVPVSVCTTHTAGHDIFDDPPEYATPYDDETEMAAIGTVGDKVRATSQFDGWGYAHLYRNNPGKLERIDSWAVEESLDERFSSGFGDLSIHEHSADPEVNLSYVAYYSAGARVISFDDAGIHERGSFIDDGGNNFWGVEQFTTSEGERLLAFSDRDYGLYILRYTGPGAPQPADAGGGAGGATQRAPGCEDQTWATPDGKPVTIPLACEDPEKDPLTYSIVNGPANGTLSAVDGNRVTYTPKTGFHGQDSFTYRAFDGKAYSPPATITLLVGKCSNRIPATAGPDNIAGTILGDSLALGDGNDVASLAQGNDCATGDGGNDQINGGSGADEIGGGLGTDRLFGDSEDDRIRGDAGNDHIRGGSGNDRVRGDAGNDFVSGGSNNDVVIGGAGRDSLIGDAGNDRMLGGSGNDTIDVGKGSNRVLAGSGRDRVEAVNRRRDRINCGTGRDSVRADRTDVVSRNCEIVRRTRVVRR